MHSIRFVCLTLATGTCLAGPITSAQDISALSVKDIGARELGAQQCNAANLGMGIWQTEATIPCSTQAFFTGLAHDALVMPISLQMSATPDVEQPVHGMTVVTDHRRRAIAPVAQRRELAPLPPLAAAR